MNEMRILSVHPYTYNGVRKVAYGIKERDRESVLTAAREMAELIKNEDRIVLVPIPSHRGYAEDTLSLACAIQTAMWRSIKKNVVVLDILKSRERESWCMLKKWGVKVSPSYFEMHATKEIIRQANVYFVDNVCDTGMTLQAAYDACGGRGNALVYARVNNK